MSRYVPATISARESAAPLSSRLLAASSGVLLGSRQTQRYRPLAWLMHSSYQSNETVDISSLNALGAFQQCLEDKFS